MAFDNDSDWYGLGINQALFGIVGGFLGRARETPSVLGLFYCIA